MKKPVRSQKLFAKASQILPGGVDSPVRAFQAVGGSPLFISRASGATIEDADGNHYIDYVMSWGPLIHGHAPAALVKAIASAARRGTSFGAPSPLEHELGEAVRALMPSMERVRFVSSGTEAAMKAEAAAPAAHVVSALAIPMSSSRLVRCGPSPRGFPQGDFRKPFPKH